jgi:hypothetical protein
MGMIVFGRVVLDEREALGGNYAGTQQHQAIE